MKNRKILMAWGQVWTFVGFARTTAHFWQQQIHAKRGIRVLQLSAKMKASNFVVFLGFSAHARRVSRRNICVDVSLVHQKKFVPESHVSIDGVGANVDCPPVANYRHTFLARQCRQPTWEETWRRLRYTRSPAVDGHVHFELTAMASQTVNCNINIWNINVHKFIKSGINPQIS